MNPWSLCLVIEPVQFITDLDHLLESIAESPEKTHCRILQGLWRNIPLVVGVSLIIIIKFILVFLLYIEGRIVLENDWFERTGDNFSCYNMYLCRRGDKADS